MLIPFKATARRVRPGTMLGALCVLLALGMSSPAAAAVEVDAARATSTEAALVSFPLTVGTGAKRLLLVGVSLQSSESVTSVTYAGVSLTRVASKAVGGGASAGSVWLY